MSISVPPMIDSGTPRFRKADPVSGAGSTIPSIFSARSLGAAAEEFSRAFSGVPAAVARKNGSAVPICATTCRLLWKKQLLARRKRSKFANWIHATNAVAAVQNRVHVRSIVRPAGVAGRELVRAAVSRYRKPVRAAGEPDKLSKNRVGNAAAKGGSKIPAGSN